MSDDLFADVLLDRHRMWGPAVVSLALHAFVMLAIPPWLVSSRLLADPPLRLSRYRVEPLSVLIPEPPARPERLKLPVAESSPPTSPVARTRKGPRLNTRIELPQVRIAPPDAISLLHTAGALAVSRDLLPKLTAWQASPKEFRSPPRVGRRGPIQPPDLDAPPTLLPPNGEIPRSDLPMPPGPSLLAPALPREVSSSTPIRIAGQHGAGTLEPPQLDEGDPVAVLAWGQPKNASQTLVTISGASAISSSDIPEDSIHAPGIVSLGMPGPRKEGPGGQLNGKGGQGLVLELEQSTPGVRATRMQRPSDGHFAFVVTGSPATLDLTHGMLGGSPVYTVYVPVGKRRSWILQYCLPQKASPAENLLEPPYPYLILRVDLDDWPDSEFLIVHALVNVEGHFEQLAFKGNADLPATAALLSGLRKWQFRPAQRDGQPVAVEVLLLIPRDDS